VSSDDLAISVFLACAALTLCVCVIAYTVLEKAKIERGYYDCDCSDEDAKQDRGDAPFEND
jgi:hypothetical protein